MRNGVQLITYADRFGGGTLTTLRELLNGPLAGVFTGVHVLPFFTPFDGADAGFDPIDHAVVDPRLGSWADIDAISETHDVMADLIVNHASDRSHQFLDFQQRGDDSIFAGMFLERRTVFPDGESDEDLRAIYRPRPGDPFTEVVMGDGSLRTMWTTFTPHQIDLDINNQQTRVYLNDVLNQFAAAGVSQVRLDAVGYAAKTPGTSCFMTKGTYAFIEQIERSVRSRAMVSLLEVHAHHETQIAVAECVDRVYDFALPALTLHTLHTGSTGPLARWLTMSPRNAYTVLDTHDGIGIIDVGPDGEQTGLLSPEQIRRLLESIDAATAGESTVATGASASNLDLYQVNSTYFSALGCDEDRYLLARLIQFLSPGIPQVYYAGLLAARNDMTLLADTGVGRDINRPFVTTSEIRSALERPVVRDLIALARFRNTHPAFSGTFHVDPSGDHELRVRWITDTASIDAVLDIAECTFELECVDGGVLTTISSWDGFTSVR